MAEGPRLIQTGTSGLTPINADVRSLGSAVPVAVVLTADYVMLDPPGYPFRPSFTGAVVRQYPHAVASGTTISVLQCEATALVDAGAATLA